MQATHDRGEAARGARGRRHAEQVKQGGGADGILTAHCSFYLRVLRVFVVRFQRGAGLCQFPENAHDDLQSERSSVLRGADPLHVLVLIDLVMIW
jgi:hypothetical protein